MKRQKRVLFVLSLLLSQSLFAHSNAFTPEFVDTLVAPYLQVQTQLAGDDLAQSQAAAREFSAALTSAPKTDDAKATVTALSGSAQVIASADDIATARTAFLALSGELKGLIEHVGTTGKTDVFVVTCPMAFAGKGGNWLQADTKVLNPYYGSMMLHCGSVNSQIAKKAQ